MKKHKPCPNCGSEDRKWYVSGREGQEAAQCKECGDMYNPTSGASILRHYDVDGWQRICTEPKDGKMILLFGSKLNMPTGIVSIGYWYEIPGSPISPTMLMSGHRGYYASRHIAVNPSHWMPLPKLPEV